MIVETELRLASATVQVVRFRLSQPVDALVAADETFRLNLCLSPRPPNSRACYERSWGPHRYEPIGDLFLQPPGHVLRTRGDPGKQASVVCVLERSLVERWWDGEVEWTDRRLEASLDVSHPHLRGLLLRLAEEAQGAALGGEALAELIAGQLAIELGRYCAAMAEGPARGGLAAWRLRLIDRRLRDGDAPPTLVELATICSLSVRQLTRGFRASRGCSINEYVTRSRIDHAKRLLAGSDSMKAVAFATGFASASSFASAFRRSVGVTPRQFRQRFRRTLA